MGASCHRYLFKSMVEVKFAKLFHCFSYYLSHRILVFLQNDVYIMHNAFNFLSLYMSV